LSYRGAPDLTSWENFSRPSVGTNALPWPRAASKPGRTIANFATSPQTLGTTNPRNRNPETPTANSHHSQDIPILQIPSQIRASPLHIPPHTSSRIHPRTNRSATTNASNLNCTSTGLKKTVVPLRPKSKPQPQNEPPKKKAPTGALGNVKMSVN
jgi:hypothetical protein